MMKHLLLICILFLEKVLGHGKLWEPPSRSTMWRRGYNTPVNPNDNELNCGGFQNHWIKYGGRCGTCGDPYQQSRRPNEAGGIFAKGVISRHYQSGQLIDLAVDITANHVGYFEFRICPNNDITKPVTQKCLDKHPVFVVGSKDGRYHVASHQNGIVSFKGKLPKGLVCSQCILQWRYRTGNRWGCSKRTGKCGKGFGPQEEFYGCSDVSVSKTFSGKRMAMRKPVRIQETGKTKSNFNLLSNPSELVKIIGTDSRLSPVLDKLTGALWTLLQTVMATNRNSKVALVQWNPIGHDIVELAKPDQLPMFRNTIKGKNHRPSSHWPPSKPTIIQADIGDPKEGPLMLSEVVVDEGWRRPAVIKKYRDGPFRGLQPVESRCYATKEFENVQGTNQWCSVNCNAGNCPKVMCKCNSWTSGHVGTSSRANPKIDNTHKSSNFIHNSLSDNVRKKSKHGVRTMPKHKLLRMISKKNKVSKNSIIPTKRVMRCRGAGKFASNKNMVGWCLENCSKGFCPISICTCSQ